MEIVAPIACTESPEKIETAVARIFPGVRLEINGDTARGEVESLSVLEHVRQQIRSRRIRASARALLMKGVSQRFLRFYVDKQAAYMGKLSLWDPEEERSPNPIMVKVMVDNPVQVVYWLTE